MGEGVGNLYGSPLIVGRAVRQKKSQNWQIFLQQRTELIQERQKRKKFKGVEVKNERKKEKTC